MKNMYELLGDEYKLLNEIKRKELLRLHPMVILREIPESLSGEILTNSISLIYDKKLDEFKNQFIGLEELSEYEVKSMFVDFWKDIFIAYDNPLKPASERRLIRAFINFLKDRSEGESDFIELYKQITGRKISNTSQEIFIEVMLYKRFPKGKSKITWIGKKTEAMKFQQHNKFTLKEFNECFIYKDGSGFKEHNRSKE